MVDCLIFTKNRPMQLELLLRSIETFDTGGMIARPATVLSALPGDGSFDFDKIFPYAEGYRIVGAEHPWIDFCTEKVGFERHVREWLDRHHGPVMFLCDDNVYYRPIVPPEPPARLPWSFRGGDYHYPFSVDGCVYEAAAVQRLLEGTWFTNPTGMEAAGHELRYRWTRSERRFTEAPRCLTNVPMNRVSESSGMPHQAIDPEALNRLFLKGARLEIPPDRDYPPHADIVFGTYHVSQRTAA